MSGQDIVVGSDKGHTQRVQDPYPFPRRRIAIRGNNLCDNKGREDKQGRE